MLPARAGTGFGLALTQAALLAIVSLFSFFIGLQYLRNGSVNKSSSMEFCCLSTGFIAICLMIGGSVLNVINAVSVAKRTGSKTSQRAFYIFLLYPIVLIMFVIPSFKEVFFTSLIFGFPVFVLGVFLLPFSSFTLMREAFNISKSDYVISDCSYCNFPFRRLAETVDAICPRCGAYNRFPAQAQGAVQAPPPPPTQQPVQRAVPMYGYGQGGGMEWEVDGTGFDDSDDGFQY